MTRSKLIAPILDKLRDQAGAGQSVALVSVQGAVKEPGEYPLIRAGGLSFLVQLAGGLEDGAYLKEVEVRRINASEDGASVEILNASLSSESTFALQSRDVVRINFLPDWNPDAAVEILGEVKISRHLCLCAMAKRLALSSTVLAGFLRKPFQRQPVLRPRQQKISSKPVQEN